MNKPITKLETISEVQLATDAHIRANKAPVVTGSDEGDLNCGGCGIVLASNASPELIHQRFETDQRLILECICGAFNIIPRIDDQTASR